MPFDDEQITDPQETNEDTAKETTNPVDPEGGQGEQPVDPEGGQGEQPVNPEDGQEPGAEDDADE